MNEKKFVSSGSKLPVWSISFLIIVLSATLWLFLFNTHLINWNENIRSNVADIKSDIKELSKDEKLQVFALLEDNQNSIDILTKRTNVTKYIQHLKAIGQKYDISFKGFNISSGNIKTQATVESSEEKWIAYVKLANFLKNYKDEPNGLFNLAFINSVAWMDSMKFSASFDIK